MGNTYHRTVELERQKSSAGLDIGVLLLPETIPCK